MSDRLIKESDVINLISEINPKKYSNPKEVLLLINTLVNKVGKIKTSYNVDRVVEQLENEGHYTEHYMESYEAGYNEGLEKAINIVEAGDMK